MYSNHFREDGERRDPVASSDDETCEHGRTVYVDGTGSLVCRECGTAALVADADGATRSSRLAPHCRWVLDRIGGRY
ncbi:hypothetical protein [Halovivax gelatinilyticus]|uniref:hypothetical protein n=1 Tax=Halovivax gelatinilyticus TaxID=2961597 RepID=UPI0020CA4FBC|nr:hypothetical protein [Halovivax gelatinilyticus]